MNEVPVAWHFIPCLGIETSPNSRHVTVRELVHTIRPLGHEGYPCIRDAITLFAVLTNGRGSHRFTLDLVRFDLGQDVVAWNGPSRVVDMGDDPLAVHGMPIPVRDLVFEVPGRYVFRLHCDGKVIAEAHVHLKEP